MSNFIQKILGGQAPPLAAKAPKAEDVDFADFAGAPAPSPVAYPPTAATDIVGDASTPAPAAGFQYPGQTRPYTKWYRVWERVTVSDFYTEMFIVPLILVVLLFHLWGTRKNRRRLRSWAKIHIPAMRQEFSSVGFYGYKAAPLPDLKTLESDGHEQIAEGLLKQKSGNEFISYATGRQNVAFVDVKVTLLKRYNPAARVAEEILSFFFEGQAKPRERMEATTYMFDGREPELVLSNKPGADSVEGFKRERSSYDGFVWAIVNKEIMNKMREGRYDLSLTATKDNSKLPLWATVMSESAEITDAMLTDDLIKAVNEAGDLLELLVITDQPVDKPKTLNDALPKKRLSLSVVLPSDPSQMERLLPLFLQYLKLGDHLVRIAHFRPEAVRKVKATRDEEAKKIKARDEQEKADDRKQKAEKDKKRERDEKLKSLGPEEQRKFLERERALELRRGQKKRTLRS